MKNKNALMNRPGVPDCSFCNLSRSAESPRHAEPALPTISRVHQTAPEGPSRTRSNAGAGFQAPGYTGIPHLANGDGRTARRRHRARRVREALSKAAYLLCAGGLTLGVLSSCSAADAAVPQPTSVYALTAYAGARLPYSLSTTATLKSATLELRPDNRYVITWSVTVRGQAGFAGARTFTDTRSSGSWAANVDGIRLTENSSTRPSVCTRTAEVLHCAWNESEWRRER